MKLKTTAISLISSWILTLAITSSVSASELPKATPATLAKYLDTCLQEVKDAGIAKETLKQELVFCIADELNLNNYQVLSDNEILTLVNKSNKVN